ncbi:MAG: sugar phosphate isomerase/epimerase [Thermoguttaceae bacterium]|nr:sugar phosphate isomerase/epimerase [Thermoguttaceae bacterium]MDW8039768.1 TIM barrel protein [Thermoguttaceae bacterium]
MFKNLNPSALGVSGHQSEVIEIALTYGFRGMDLDIEDFASRVRRRGFDYAARLIRSASKMLRLGNFTLPFDWEGDEEAFRAGMEKVPEYGVVASQIGCPRCVLSISPASDQLPYHENFEVHRRRLAEIAEAMAPAGIRIGLRFQAAPNLRKNRTFQFIHDLDATTLLISMSGAKNVGLVIDVWDWIVSGLSLEKLRTIPLEQIVAVQVADLPANVPINEAKEEQRLLPGDGGGIDIVGFLRILAQMGYQGPVTPMPYRGLFGRTRRDTVARMAGDALDKVWRAAGLPSDYRASATAAVAAASASGQSSNEEK